MSSDSSNTLRHKWASRGLRLLTKRSIANKFYRPFSSTEEAEGVAEGFRSIGIYVPENWTSMDYVPDNRGDIYSGLVIAGAVLALICGVLRMVSIWKRKVGDRFRWEDVLATWALVGVIVQGVICVINYQTMALGYRTIDSVFVVADADIISPFYGFITHIVSEFTRYPAKITAVLFIYRTIRPSQCNITRRIVQAMFIIITLYHMSGIFIYVFQCTPPAAFWKDSFKPQESTLNRVRCISRVSVHHGIPIANSITTSVLCILLLSVFRRFHISLGARRTDWAFLGAMYITCFGASISSILNPVLTSQGQLMSDPARSGAHISLTSMLETSLFLAAASIPSIRSILYPPLSTPEITTDMHALTDARNRGHHKSVSETSIAFSRPSTTAREPSRPSFCPSSCTELHTAPSYPTSLDPLQILMPRNKYSAGRSHEASVKALAPEERDVVAETVADGQVVITTEFEMKSYFEPAMAKVGKGGWGIFRGLAK